MVHDYDKILTRLTVILQRLYEGEILSVKVLAEEFNVTTKTIQRDFNERLIHFPIEKSGRSWIMQKGFRLERARKPDEALVLDMLETIAESIGSGFGGIATSLLGRLKNHSVSVVNSKTVIEDILEHHHLFLQIEKAIETRRVVSFVYGKKARRMKACKIVSFEGYWYLYGQELPAEKLKTFHLKSIEALRIEDEEYVYPDKADTILERALNSWFEPHNEPFESVLHASADIAKYFVRRPLSSTQRTVKTYSDGSIDIALDVTGSRELLHEVKKWVPNLLVRSPQSLALEAGEMARAFVEAQNQIIFESGHDVV